MILEVDRLCRWRLSELNEYSRNRKIMSFIFFVFPLLRFHLLLEPEWQFEFEHLILQHQKHITIRTMSVIMRMKHMSCLSVLFANLVP